MQTDPVGYEDGMNWYAYVANDPVNNADPTGNYVETLWDVASLSMGVVSLKNNVSAGNWGAAAVDVGGIVLDGLATAAPLVPAGASMAINATRGAESAISGARLEKSLASDSQLTELAEGGGIIISQPAKQADRIAAQHGVDPANVQKVSSSAHTAKDGSQVQTHAFRDEITNQVFEPKSMIDKKKVI